MNYDRLPVSLFGDVLQLSQRRPVFTADFYSIDGSTLKVGAFIDWNDFSHTLSQSSGSSLQVAVPAAHADFNGKLCATFTGSEYYTSTRPAAAFSFAHDGSGCESTHVYTLSAIPSIQVLACTNNLSNPAGYCHWFNNTPSARLFVSNGSVTVDSIGSASPGIGTPSHSTVAFDARLPSAARVWIKGTLGASAALGAAVSTGVPTATLRLGAASGGTANFSGRWHSGMYSPSLNDLERTAKFSWIQQDTGITP